MPKNKKSVNVIVSALYSTLEFEISKTSICYHLFEQIVKTLGLREFCYFGLQYTDKNGELSWINLDKKFSSYEFSTSPPYKLRFTVKYYPEDVTDEPFLAETRRYFYFQVKNDIMQSKIFCPAETAVVLASYSLFERYGMISSDIPISGLPIDKLIPTRNQYELSDDYWQQKIFEKFRELDSLSTDDAILEYLKVAQDLETYGMETFEIKNKSTNLILGVSASGLSVFNKDDTLSPRVAFSWLEIRRLSFHNKKFTIKPTDSSNKYLHFYVTKQKSCEQIMSLCRGNHELYIRRRKPESIETQQMKIQANEEREAKIQERQHMKDERLRRITVETKLQELEKQMMRRDSEYTAMVSTLKEYDRRMSVLQESLTQERLDRERLEHNQKCLEELNEELKMAQNSTLAEQQALRDQRDALLLDVENQRASLNAKEEDKRRAEEELERLRLESEKLNVAMSIENGEYNSQDVEKGNVEFAVTENLMDPEESQTTEVEKNDQLKRRLNDLKIDLEQFRDAKKMRNIDRIHEENFRLGVDKFKTLRMIKKGNTKKRVDEFESM